VQKQGCQCTADSEVKTTLN